MPTRSFDNSKMATYSSAPLARTIEMSSYAVPLTRGRAIDERAVSAEIGWPPEAVVDLGALGKGVCWALAIEGSAAMCIYFACQLWILFR